MGFTNLKAEKAAERGEEHRLAGRYEAAVEEFTRAIDLVPGYTYALGSRGQALSAMGHIEAALADFDRAVELDPDLGWVYVERGHTLADAAYADFSRAIELGLDDADTYVSRGEAALRLHMVEDARADAGLALERDPDHLDALVLRGLANWMLDRLYEADIDLMRADRLSSDSPVVARWIAEIKPTLDGQIEEALMTAPSFAEMVADFARELVAAGAAVKETRTMEATDFATMVSGLRDVDEADMEDAAVVETRLTRDPGDPFALAVRAVLHRSAGRHDAALADLDTIPQALVGGGATAGRHGANHGEAFNSSSIRA